MGKIHLCHCSQTKHRGEYSGMHSHPLILTEPPATGAWFSSISFQQSSLLPLIDLGGIVVGMYTQEISSLVAAFSSC